MPAEVYYTRHIFGSIIEWISSVISQTLFNHVFVTEYNAGVVGDKVKWLLATQLQQQLGHEKQAPLNMMSDNHWVMS